MYLSIFDSSVLTGLHKIHKLLASVETQVEKSDCTVGRILATVSLNFINEVFESGRHRRLRDIRIAAELKTLKYVSVDLPRESGNAECIDAGHLFIVFKMKTSHEIITQKIHLIAIKPKGSLLDLQPTVHIVNEF